MSLIPFGRLENRSYFFDHGLRFSCRQCGRCCVGEHGTIYVSRPEIEAIAASLRIPVDSFAARYLYPFKDSYSIKEDDQGRCLFFEGGCAIYDLRPMQCRTFPFWFNILRSEERWRRAGRQCPGIGQGRLYVKSELLEMLVQSMPI